MVRFVKQHGAALMMILCEAAAGVLLLAKPMGFTQGLVIALGVLLALAGVRQTVGYCMTKAEQAAKSSGLFRGLTALTMGLCAALNSEAILAAFPVVTTLYGGVVFLSGLYKVQLAVDAARMKQGKLYPQVISALFTLAFAVLTMMHPFASVAAMWTFIGAMLLANAVVDGTALVLAVRRTAARSDCKQAD